MTHVTATILYYATTPSQYVINSIRLKIILIVSAKPRLERYVTDYNCSRLNSFLFLGGGVSLKKKKHFLTVLIKVEFVLHLLTYMPKIFN